MMVFMLLITEQIPATSDVVPLVAKFYMAVMLEMALALVVTCYVIRCYHSHTNEVPQWMKEILVKKLANFFGIEKSKELKSAEKEQKKMSQLNTENVGDYGFVRGMTPNGSKRNDEIDNDVHENGVLHLADGAISETEPPNFLRERVKTVDSIGKKILGNLEYIANSIEDAAKQELVKEEWLIVANVMDRIAIGVFSIAMAATMVSIFYQAPRYVDWAPSSPWPRMKAGAGVSGWQYSGQWI